MQWEVMLSGPPVGSVYTIALLTHPTHVSLASLELTMWTEGREFQMFYKTVMIMSNKYSLNILLVCNQISYPLGLPHIYYVVENDL